MIESWKRLKNILKRVEEITNELLRIKLQDLKLLSIKIATNNPTIGSFRIKGFFKKDTFIEIFEFLFLGKVIKYSYTLVENEKSILRYDNAPHHQEIHTAPHHKHLKDQIQPLKDPQITEFIKEVITIINL